jgi:ubiquitin-protein ligase
MPEVVIEKETLKRLAKDVKEIIKNPLIENRIFYKHDEDNILKGKALIVGPEGTPYENGYYLFEFEYPANYPHSPPKVIYHTNDGLTRFNPNLYRSGKVCISILNTWRGDQWSSCQTISSILLTLCTVLNDNPLLNEPNVKETDKDIVSYNKILTYKNIFVGINGVLEWHFFQKEFSEFRDIICEEFRNNYNKIISKIENNIKDDGVVCHTSWYSSYKQNGEYNSHCCTLNYKILQSNMEKLYKKYNKKI